MRLCPPTRAAAGWAGPVIVPRESLRPMSSSLMMRLIALVLLSLWAVLAAAPPPAAAAAAEQVAALRLQAEVAVEAACMQPPDGRQDAAIARLDATPVVKQAFCRCFAAEVIRHGRQAADPEDLIDRIGVPPEPEARRAVLLCLGETR